jgi:limonene-1,2-epoxide hydrolase
MKNGSFSPWRPAEFGVWPFMRQLRGISADARSRIGKIPTLHENREEWGTRAFLGGPAMSVLNRRSFFPTAICSALATAALPASAVASESTDAEKANVKLIRDLVATWDAVAATDPPDLTKLAPYFSPDCAFRLRPTDTAPEHGLDVVAAAIKRGTANGQKVRHDLLDSFAKGPVVVMEKLNQFITREKTRTSHVVAVYLIKDGKIVEWTEYFIGSA